MILSTSEVKARTAVFTIAVPTDAGNGILNKSIDIRYQGGYDKVAQQKILMGLDHKTVELTNLTPYKEYHLNVTVANQFFKSKGQMLIFKTLQDGKWQRL